MRRTLVALIALFLSFVACGVPLSSSEAERTPEATYLRQTVDKLTSRRFDELESAMDPAIRQPNIASVMAASAALFSPGPPSSTRVVGWNFIKGIDGARFANVSIEYGYPGNKWLLVSSQLRGEPGAFRIWAFNVQVLPASVAELNGFTLR